jgi:hypothetical protein
MNRRIGSTWNDKDTFGLRTRTLKKKREYVILKRNME